VSPSDSALGFKPSTAPPLDPSVAQFVPAPIIAHYQQTAAWAGSAAASSVVANTDTAAPRHVRRSRRGVGGPEQMSGAVVANLDALQSASPTPAAYSPAAGSAAAVVFFPGDGTVLNAEGRAQVRQAVDAFKAAGGQGYVRVIGHSSSRTANMPVEKHLELIFQRSKQRADSVARELIRQGIPASRVLEEAVGDSQPVYYESMPKGEDGNRRAEIFLQG
jgi:outer membrane protein OmpA-like peptidoglycan-associated protein